MSKILLLFVVLLGFEALAIPMGNDEGHLDREYMKDIITWLTSDQLPRHVNNPCKYYGLNGLNTFASLMPKRNSELINSLLSLPKNMNDAGAGNSIDETKYQRVINEACIRSTDILKNGGSAMDACEEAIIRLENCGNTNAGFGSNLTWDGKIQCDASMMDGSNLQFGACTNVSTVKNPIQLARIICDRQSKMLSFDRIPPMILAGDGAEQYAQDTGCTMIETEKLVSSKAKFCYNHYKSKVSEDEKMLSVKLQSLDTVGAVCIDSNGNSAAGCSSGGLILKLSGRVGQAATYGAGCWASDTEDLSVATSTTGNGEYLMKTFLAKEISTDLFTSDCAVTSLHRTFKNKFLESPFLPTEQELYGGSISIIYYPKLYSGEVLWCHTTKSFCVGYMSTNQKTPKFVHSPLPTYSMPGRTSVVNGYNFNLRV